MKNQHLIAALILFAASVSFILISNFLMFAIIGEVNRKVPDAQRVSYLGWHFDKYQRTIREYRRLYPGGQLVRYHFVSLALGMIFLLAFAWEFGFFRFGS